MAHSEICPVCSGEGELENKESTESKRTCHGCGGKGWVVVEDTQYVPVYPRPCPYQPCLPPYDPYKFIYTISSGDTTTEYKGTCEYYVN